MLPSRPVIFISAVTKELGTAREKIADVLRLLHFQPVVQQEFPNHTGIVRAMLETELEPCAAVIQLVGHRYGWDVPGVSNPHEAMSYTQYEACWAHRKPILVWYLIIGDDYPVDAPNDEDATKKLLQSAYRARLQSTAHLYHPVADIKDVEIAVFRMQQDLDQLRPPQFQQLPLLDSGGGPRESPPAPAIQTTPTTADLEKIMRGVLLDFVPALQQVRQNASPQDDAAAEDALYTRLAEILGKTPAEARAEISALAKKTKVDLTASLLVRAKAAYADKDYPAAEKLALQAVAENPAAAPAAFLQAAEAASEQTQYPRALDHYRAAAALTSQQSDVLAWADLQCKIGWLLYLDGRYAEQATLMHRVWQACEKAGHPEHPVALRAHNLWANALDDQGKHAEAEAEHRTVLAIRERVLGPEHPDTLASRNNLAAALDSQGKYAEAEAENRARIAIEERVLGLEHPDTLTSRMNLANTLYSQGKPAEAEAEHRAVLATQERVLGPEHPGPLGSRMNLANALDSQGKYAEAEADHRAVLAIQERVLGPEHPDTLLSCYNLSFTLENLGRQEEALALARRALAGRNKVLGENHPQSQKAKRRVERLEKK